MMSRQTFSQLARSVAIATGIAGLAFASAPVQAQMQNMPANSQQMQTSDRPLSTLLEQAAGSTDSFDTLAQAVQAAGLSNALNSGEAYTIFAPTDAAFAELPQGTLQALLQPQNRGLLRQVLSYHVVPGRVTSSQLSTGPVETLGGGIAVRVTPERVIVNNGSVVRANIPAANGVVHVVNRVLLPSELRQQLANL